MLAFSRQICKLIPCNVKPKRIHKLIHVHRSTFLPGAYFDLRVELHAYDKENKNNATQVTPYTHFKTQVRKDGGPWQDASSFFHMDQEPGLENWNFTWVDSIDARFGSDPGVDVAVSSRIWRKLKFDSPGVYDVSVTYGKKNAYTVRYTVPEVSERIYYIHVVIIIMTYIVCM